MKLTVKQKDGCAEGVVIECTTTEALVLNHAMRIYAANDEWINDISRDIMRRMLEVEPIFEETEGSKK